MAGRGPGFILSRTGPFGARSATEIAMNGSIESKVGGRTSRAPVALAALALLATLGVSGCATGEKSLVEQGARPMSEAELAAAFSRAREMDWVSAAGLAGSSKYMTDGRVVASWNGGSATGRYRLHSGMVCSTYPELAGGAERCSRVYRTGDNRYRSFLADGTPNSSFSFRD